MKKWFSLSMLCFISASVYSQVTSVHSQITRHITFQVTLTDTAYRHFFDHHRDIHWMLVDFEENEPISLSLYHDSNAMKYYDPHLASFRDEFYDLEFEGDILWLSEKYNLVIMPTLPAVDITYLPGVTDTTNIKTHYQAKASIYRDSIVYHFNGIRYPDDSDIIIYLSKRYPLPRAEFNGKLTRLADTIGANYRKNRDAMITDSVAIFYAIVERDGSLSGITLDYGQQSPFSDAVWQVLQDHGSDSWLPQLQGGRPVRAAIHIFARLNADGNITVAKGVAYQRHQ